MTTPAALQSFGALRHARFRPFVLFIAAAMTGDFVEHVISYWVLFQKFESPALAGFAVVSHWLPFLLFSILVGFAARSSETNFVEGFVNGSRDLLGVALIIGIARGVTVIMTKGQITDTILKADEKEV